MSLITFLRDNNLGLNLLGYYILALVLATMIVIAVWKIVTALTTQKIIDKHLRQTRASIARTLTELEDSKNNIPKVDVEVEVDVEAVAVEVPSILGGSEVDLKGKKTRAMSMEERWAEFDKKRSMRNTA